MIPIICTDAELGMILEDCRLLDSKNLRKRILEITARDCVWMNSYTATAFAGEEMPQAIIDEDFLDKAEKDDYVLVEDLELLRYQPKIRRVLLFRWEKTGKATRVLDLNVDEWMLLVAEDVPTDEGLFVIEVLKP